MGNHCSKTLNPSAAVLALVALTAACASGGREPEPVSPVADMAPAEATLADTLPDFVVAEAAEEQGLDPEAVVESKHEAERRVEELEPEKQAEFESLFGHDPLGLARNPGNAEKYEIPLEMNSRVERWIEYFQNTIPERFDIYLMRLGRYEDMIRRKLRVAGLPEDLIYLSLIESGMNPNAYSRSHAVGLWQFIRGTARLYDLEVSWWLDERRDPILATDAAIGFLSDLYDEFGSWYLAAAAYNGGPGRVRRGLASTGSDDFCQLAQGSALRSETRNYVPKLIAAAIIAKDPESYGFTDVQKEPAWEYETVRVPDATSFDVLADAAGTDEETIQRLNPQFPRRVTPPDRPVDLRVPVGTGEQFAVNYASIPEDERVTWLMHTITRGQTLGLLAARYGTSVQAIQAANNNLNPRRLQIGQRLIIPRSPTAGTTVASNTTSRAASQPLERPYEIVVQRGDTLWALARQHGVTTSQLMSWNGLQTSRIKPGQRLTIQK